jgi:hypothetical protein
LPRSVQCRNLTDCFGEKAEAIPVYNLSGVDENLATQLAEPSSKWTVFVADNFHYMDESETYQLGQYSTYPEALEICQGIVARDVLEAYKVGRSGDQMYEAYVAFGEDPFIVGATTHQERFSAWGYAKQLCRFIDDLKSSGWLE